MALLARPCLSLQCKVSSLQGGVYDCVIEASNSREDIESTNLEQHHSKTCKVPGTTHKSEHQQQIGRIHMAGSLSGVVDCDDAVGRNVPLSVFPCTSLVGGKTGLAIAPQFLDAG